MTEAGKKWIAEVNRKRIPGGEVGIVHPIDAGAVLRAFCAEVECQAAKSMFNSREWDLTVGTERAFNYLKRELLGD